MRRGLTDALAYCFDCLVVLAVVMIGVGVGLAASLYVYDHRDELRPSWLVESNGR